MIWRVKYIGLSKMHILVFLEHLKCNLMQYPGYTTKLKLVVSVSVVISWPTVCAENKIDVLLYRKKRV